MVQLCQVLTLMNLRWVSAARNPIQSNSLIRIESFLPTPQRASQVEIGGLSGYERRVYVDNRTMIYFDDQTLPIPRVVSVNNTLEAKTKLLSALVSDAWLTVDERARTVLEHIQSGVDIFFIESGASDEHKQRTYDMAFGEYRFCLILESRDSGGALNPAILHAIARHAVPVYNGFFELSTMFANGVVAWNEKSFSFNVLVSRLRQLNKNMRFLWSYQQILQEIIWYRYSAPIADRRSHVEKWTHAAEESNHAIVGIYSANANFALRQAIRQSWGRALNELNVEVLFFLSEALPGDQLVLNESSEYADIVFLSVQSGYKNNSRKGVRFIQWIAANRSKFAFLIKTDDDIYFRPQPLIEMLKYQIPAGYIWGFIDYISPVPKNPTDPFYSPRSVYPFPTFPTYPRGVVRVMSMDIVHALADMASQKRLRMIYGDDPSTGVHLRQLVMEKVIPFIAIDDFSSYTRFAMVPTCKTSWSSAKNTTWIVHHVNATQIACMWTADHLTAGNTAFCECLDSP